MQEDAYTEFKSSFTDAVIESLVAFANTSGGKVLIGVNDSGLPVKGFTLGQESLQQWINEIKNKTQPSLIPDAGIISLAGVTVAELSIKEFPIKPVSFKGRYFKRVNNANHQLSLNEISEMHLRSFNSSWDSYVNPKYDLSSISMEKVRRFISMCNEDKKFVITDDPLTVLKKFELVSDAGITSGCYLLFAQSDVFIAAIELGRFSTPTSIKDGLTVRSDLFTEVEDVLNFIKKHINKEYIITGDPQREERWQYPLPALREIVINMIVHRDYMHTGDSSIKIYNDRIEFFNFGKLPEGISIEQLISGDYTSTVRNKMVASIFKEAQLIEKYGSGIKRIQEGFINYGLIPPLFQDIQGGFRVTIYAQAELSINDKLGDKLGDRLGDKLGDRLSKNQQRIVDAIRENGKVSLSELAKVVGISQTSIENNVRTLQKENIIKRTGPVKGGYWEIIVDLSQ